MLTISWLCTAPVVLGVRGDCRASAVAWLDQSVALCSGARDQDAHPDPDIVAAHGHCRDHRAEVVASVICGCFHCCGMFTPGQIVDWIDPAPEMVNVAGRLGQSALCPSCGIDAVIGDRSGFPITEGFLHTMRAHWF